MTQLILEPAVCLGWKKDKFLPWLTVKKRYMGENSGCILYSERQFVEDDIITVYFGVK